MLSKVVVAVWAVLCAAIITIGLASNSSGQAPVYSSPSMDMTQSTPTASDQTPASASAVTIQNFAFTPADITVPVNTTVTWTNMDNTAHTVTSDTTGGPSSGQLQNGQMYSFKFSQPGTYHYHCSIHPQMLGTVTVTDTGATPPQATPTPSTTSPTNGTTTPSPTSTSTQPSPTAASTSTTPSAQATSSATASPGSTSSQPTVNTTISVSQSQTQSQAQSQSFASAGQTQAQSQSQSANVTTP